MQNFTHCGNRVPLSDYCTVCLPHINTQTQVTFGFRNNNYRRNPRGCSLYLLNCIKGYQLIKLLVQLIFYSATTRNRALARSLSNHNDFWKQKILNFLTKGPIKRLSLIVRVNVVLNRTVVVDSDWRFDNLCDSHLQSQGELWVAREQLENWQFD